MQISLLRIVVNQTGRRKIPSTKVKGNPPVAGNASFVLTEPRAARTRTEDHCVSMIGRKIFASFVLVEGGGEETKAGLA